MKQLSERSILLLLAAVQFAHVIAMGVASSIGGSLVSLVSEPSTCQRLHGADDNSC